jgi:hypothetical protein
VGGRDLLPRGELIFACPDGGSLRFDRKGISGIETSRREAAELFRIAASTAVKWLQRLHHESTTQPGRRNELAKLSESLRR